MWENLVKECQLPLEESEHMKIVSSLELSENEYSPVNVILAKWEGPCTVF